MLPEVYEKYFSTVSKSVPEPSATEIAKVADVRADNNEFEFRFNITEASVDHVRIQAGGSLTTSVHLLN